MARENTGSAVGERWVELPRPALFVPPDWIDEGDDEGVDFVGLAYPGEVGRCDGGWVEADALRREDSRMSLEARTHASVELDEGPGHGKTDIDIATERGVAAVVGGCHLAIGVEEEDIAEAGVGIALGDAGRGCDLVRSGEGLLQLGEAEGWMGDAFFDHDAGDETGVGEGEAKADEEDLGGLAEETYEGEGYHDAG